MLTIDGKVWALIPDAARYVGVSCCAMRKWTHRHRSEINTRHIGASLLVLVDDLQAYRKRAARA